jgi:hypothetical protein
MFHPRPVGEQDTGWCHIVARAVAVILIVGVTVLVSRAVPLGASEIFTIRGVVVDTTAASSAEARTSALAGGQRAALKSLYLRLVVAEDVQFLPQDDEAVADLVAGFEIDEERVSTTRYRAVMTINFNPQNVRLHLRSHRVRFAESVSDGMIVLPVLLDRGQALLWTEPNSWWDAWANRPSDASLLPVSIPLGDVADITAIQEARVLQATSDELRKFAARYDVGSIVVAIAQAPQMAPEVTPADESQEAILAALVEDAAANTGPKAVVGPEEDAATARAIIQDVVASPMSVTLRHIGLGGEENMQVIIEPEPGEGLMAFLGRGVEASLLEVRERWKLTNLLDFDQKNVLIAKVPLDGRLASWLDVYEQLRRLPVIVGVELAELSKAAAMVRLTHLGDLEQLSFALDREALELVIDEAGWVVQHRGKKTPLNNTDNSQ